MNKKENKYITTPEGNLMRQDTTGHLHIQASSQLQQTVKPNNTVWVPQGGEYRLTLADGTEVWLNAESKLKFPTQFTGNKRTVELSGEAYFEVTGDTSCPFIIHTEGIEVKVSGTSFGIRSYQEEDAILTTLVSGSVDVESHNSNVRLTPEHQAVFNPYDQSFMLVDDRNGLAENLGGDDRIRVDRYGNVFCGNQVGCGWLAEARKLSASAVSNLFIETVFVNGEPIVRENEEPFILSATDDQCNLTFRYTAVCFDEYEQVRYRYKLEGLERGWNPPTRNLEVRYTNLPPGKYRFVADVAYKGNWFGR